MRRALVLLLLLGTTAAFGQEAPAPPPAAAPAAPPAPAPAPAAALAPAAAPRTLGGSLLVQPMAAYAGGGAWSFSNLSYGSGSTLGLTLKAGSGRARAEGSVEAAVLTGSSADLAWAVAASPYGRPDEILVPATASSQGAALAARVRTLYTKLDLDWAMFTAGRQVVNYSRGSLWSPTDIFTELDLSGISPVRRGTDALRLTFPLDVTAGLDLVAAPTLTPAHGKYSGRLNALIYGVDAALVAARDGSLGGWLFGMDFKADMEAGITAEVIYHQPDYGGLGWTKAAAGLDWSVGDFILATEYYFNGGGSKADLLYPGTNNLTASVTWDVSQLVKLMASVTGDMDRRTGVATFTTTISAAQNADLTGFIQAGNGIAGYGIGYGVNGASWMVQTGLGLAVKF